MVAKSIKVSKCNDTRKCFAKVFGGCMVLDTTYPEGKQCPFCKPTRNITKGKKYS